jgi:hypothetical protein
MSLAAWTAVGLCVRAVPFSGGHPTFGRSIAHIVRLGADEEVVRVDAIPHVAFMAHQQAVWDGAAMEFPRQPVSLPPWVRSAA